jgi:hypothetical protein
VLVEALVLGTVANVLGDYLTGLLTNRQSERNRAELIALIETQIKATREVGSKVEAMNLAVRELDAIVKIDQDLSWRDDRLIVRPSGRIRRSLPSPQQALDQLVDSVIARRRELGLPLTAEEAAASGHNEPVEGDLIPPDQPAPTTPTPDLAAEVLSLPTEVLREKERRRRETERD